jgi:3-isopropylmalate/(R)-2-methylmalate dehydratase large subunit
MGMTATQKILAYKSQKEKVSPKELVFASVDIALGNDITAPIAIDTLKDIGIKKVFDKEKVVLVPDHFTPNKDIKSAMQCKKLRDFAYEYEIKNYFEVGRVGIEHALLPEKGLVLPGMLVVGADSHTCTYGALGCFSTGIGSTDLAYAMATGKLWFRVPEAIKFVYKGKLPKWVSGKDLILYTIGKIGVDGATYKTMEFVGEVIKELSMDDRFTMANMAIEAGAKNGYFEVDEKTIAYVKERSNKEFEIFTSDEDADYEDEIIIDVSSLEPVVALPHLPSNIRFVSEVKMPIDQVYIGSCTNGRITDLRIAATILKGKKIDKRVRCIVAPATQEIYRQAIKEGLIDIFLDAECVISPPTCGPCLGGHMGVLAEGERAIATTNRNFVGRMGHPKSEVILASPAVAAASGILGRVAHPDEVM